MSWWLVGQAAHPPLSIAGVAYSPLGSLEGYFSHLGWLSGSPTCRSSHRRRPVCRLFSATKRKARGYRSSEYQIAMLYFVAGKLEIPYYS